MTIEAELIARYGPDVLEIERNVAVPPRIARERHQLAVLPRGGQRRKLVKEQRREGYKAHVARHRITGEVTANIVFSNALPAFSKHARSVLAEIPTRDILSLYGNRPPRPKIKPYEVGDKVQLTAGLLAGKVGKLIERKARASWMVDVDGKRVVHHIHTMIRIDPG